MNIGQENLLGYKLKTYSFMRVVDSGNFSKVYEAYDEETKTTVAIKSISMDHFRNPKVKELVEGEIKCMKACRGNPNIIKFIDNLSTDRSVLIVMEYCQDGTLEGYIKGKKRLTQDKATYFLKQIMNGFKGLHQKNVIHRDFKAANVLLHNGEAKIADLGFAKMLTHKEGLTNTNLGTPTNMAPQIYEKKSYGMKVDIWSLGVVYYQMIYGKQPYQGNNEFLLNDAKKYPPNLQRVNISESAKDFILKCLTFNADKRISWAQLYSHPLITEQLKVKYGVKASQLDVKKNISFYNNKINFNSKPLQFQPLQFVQEKSEKLKVVEFNKLKAINEQKKKTQAGIARYKERYLNRRNNDIFVFKYIVPYVHVLSKLPVSHSHVMYLLCKKTYHDLMRLRELVNRGDDIFKDNQYFEEFKKSGVYAEMKEMLEDDVMVAKIQANQYKQYLNGASLGIKNQQDIDKIVHKQWQMFVREQASEYENTLMTCMHQAEGNAKQKLIMVIEALAYFKHHNEQAHFQVFDRQIENINFQDAQIGINNRLEYTLSQFKE